MIAVDNDSIVGYVCDFIDDEVIRTFRTTLETPGAAGRA